MPLTEREYDLEAEYEQLDEQVAEYAQEFADAEDNSTYQGIAGRQGRTAQDHRSGVAWALGYPDGDLPGAGWGTDTITLGAPTKGEADRVDNAVDTLDCAYQNAWVAVATVEAPYLEHDPHNIGQAALHKTIGNVARLHPNFVEWVDHRADSLSQGGDTGKSFMASVANAASTTSHEQNG
jgi:hypothetical protein